MRVALYARVSTEEQAQSYGLGAQMDALRAEALRRGYEIVQEYRDEGWSGASLDRPDMNRLRQAARAKAFEVVLVPALDRLARSIEVQSILFAEFRKLGVRIELVSARVEDTKEGRVLLNLLGSIAEYEREAIRDRMMGGKRRKAGLGLVVSPGNSPYGYEPDTENKGKLRILEREAEIVRLIYDLCIRGGMGVERIMAELRRRGTPARKGNWGTTQVARILKDERYIGKSYYGRHKILPDGQRRQGREPIPIPIPAIVTPELREAALAQMRKNKVHLVGRPANFRYMLSGLIRCAECGSRFDPEPNKGRRAYRHSRTGKHTMSLIAADLIEKEVRAAIKEALQSPQTLLEAANAYEAGRGAASVEMASQEAFLQKQIAKIQAREKRLVRLVADDEEQLELVQAELRQLGNDRRRLGDQLQSVQDRMARTTERPRNVESLLAQAWQGIDDLDEQGWFNLLRDVVDEIKVDSHGTVTIVGVLEAGKFSPPSKPSGGLPRDEVAGKSSLRFLPTGEFTREDADGKSGPRL